MQLSNSNLEILRTRPSSTKLDLFIFQPRVVMQCRVNNAAIAKGAQTIPYNTVTTGSFSNVEADMTLLVGSSAGASDYGRIRLRSATSAQFTVAENSHIPWVNGAHLTVLRYWEVWPVFPRIIQNPANETDVIFYKDYDIPYSNQNSILGTFVNAGSHRPVLIENGSGTTYYSSTGTLNLLGDTLTYDWAFEGGTPTGSTSATPGYVTYTTPGDYVTRLKVTSSSGAIDTTYRYVSVKNKIGNGTNTPVQKWTMSSLNGSRGEGGYSAEFTVYDSISLNDNAVVMLRAEDWYGSTKVSLGGNYPNTSEIFFVGYIESGSIKYNYKDSSYSFRASSITKIMKDATGFSVSVKSVPNPISWTELIDMDCRRALYHYNRWHSTLHRVVDFSFIGTDYKIQYFDADRTSLYDALNNLMESTLVGSIAADRQGRLWAEVHPKAYNDPTGSFTPVMEITRRDWAKEPRIEERFSDELSYLEVGGIAYSGSSTGTFSAHLSEAPGTTPSYRGNVGSPRQGLALGGQTHLNTLSGHLFANENTRYPSVDFDMAIPVRNLDIAPYETVQVNIDPPDTVRGIGLYRQFIPNNFSWKYDADNQILIVSMDTVSLVNGVPGDTIPIPAIADDYDGGFDFPGFEIPDLEIFDLTPYYGSSNIPNVVIAKVGVSAYPDFLVYTRNFTSSSPNWFKCTTGLSGLTLSDVYNILITPSGACFMTTNDSAYRAEYVGATWVAIISPVDILTALGASTTAQIISMGQDEDRLEEVRFHIVGVSGGNRIHGIMRWDGSQISYITDTEYVTATITTQRSNKMWHYGNKWISCFNYSGALGTSLGGKGLVCLQWGEDGEYGVIEKTTSANSVDFRCSQISGNQIYGTDDDKVDIYNVDTNSFNSVTLVTGTFASLTHVANAIAMWKNGLTTSLSGRFTSNNYAKAVGNGTSYVSVGKILTRNVDCMFCPNAEHIFIAGLDGNSSGINIAMTDNDGTTWVDKTGDMNTTLGITGDDIFDVYARYIPEVV